MATEKLLIDPNALRKQGFLIPDFDKAVVFVDDILKAPTVDAVEVVRCEKCRYFEKVHYWPDGTKDVCRLLKRQVQLDGFCWCGERKHGE